jgi:hypothetical protein
MKNMSENFTYQEFTRSKAALQLGIHNSPSDEEIMNGQRLAFAILEPCRARFEKSISPSSWFRCLKLNRAIGSGDTSQHRKGEAVDFTIKGVDLMKVYLFIYNNLLFDQIILEKYNPDTNSGWIHCSYKKVGNRKSALTFDGKTYRNFKE